MQAGAQDAERFGVLRVGRHRALKLGESLAVGSAVEGSRRHEVGEDPDPVDLDRREAGGVEKRDQPVDVEPARQRVGFAPSPVTGW
jgi:hypothetical protein